MSFKNLPRILLCATGLIAMNCSESKAQVNAQQHFKVSVLNATADNALSPYLVIVHRQDSSLVEVGATASAGLQQIAETGGTSILQAELAANPNVLSVSKVEGGPLTAAERRDVTFDLSDDLVNSGALVTVVAMIGKSNDSFIAARNIPLSSFTAKGLRMDAQNFDAGTEKNTGNVEDFGPNAHPVDGVEGNFSYDRGLNRSGNAPEIIGWGPVAAELSLFKL